MKCLILTVLGIFLSMGTPAVQWHVVSPQAVVSMGDGDRMDVGDTVVYGVTRTMPSFYNEMKRQLTYPQAWGRSSVRRFTRWRAAARQTVMECMQDLPPAATRYDVEVVATERRHGYEARKISFNLSAWYRVPAYLLIPDGEGPFPGIVLLHDHGAHFTIGKEKMVRPLDVSEVVTTDADEWVARCYDGCYVGDSLASRGYVVLAVDALLWGERGRKEGADYDAQQALSANFLQMGASWGAYIHIDDVRTADFLASLPQVDAGRIGCLGFSMGAYRSWMLAALSDRIAASASVCWMNTTEHLMTLTNNQNKGGSAYSMILPGLRRYLDYPHVASIACPKPSLFFNGTRDKLFPVAGVEEAYATMRQVWHDRQADDRLVTRLWDEKHFFSREMQQEVFSFFDRWLK